MLDPLPQVSRPPRNGFWRSPELAGLLITTAVYLKPALTLRLFAGSLPREDTTVQTVTPHHPPHRRRPRRRPALKAEAKFSSSPDPFHSKITLSRQNSSRCLVFETFRAYRVRRGWMGRGVRWTKQDTAIDSHSQRHEMGAEEEGHGSTTTDHQ
jgi:hypothetical protein